MSREYSGGRENGRKKGRGIFLAVVFIILGGLAFFVLTAKKEAESEKQFTFECNAERVEMLNKCGLIVEPDPESKEVEIPTEFNASYNEYNELQKAQGFDLLPYSGKKVTIYTYKILNYPDLPDNVVVNLLFDDHLMIGADITYNDAENGFTKPLMSDTIQSALE
ncbi:MAG: DUF4830 domain-containing protein [Oscillospiraceae bacterium]|nr:DUF4830 domain-containing protein [Oscillospiraceae bacterium]